MPIKVSIIVPNYNHSLYLSERINSILAQSYQNFELILLDDNSTDNSVDILKEYQDHPKVSHIEVNPQNSGSTFRQWDKGITCSTGEFIWIAESDDVAHPEFLARLVPILEKNTSVAFSYCQSFEINDKSKIIGDYFRHTEDLSPDLWLKDFTLAGNEFVENFLSKRNCIPNVSAALFRRIAFQQLDESIFKCRYLGDWLFYIKTLKTNGIYFTSDKLNYFRTHLNTTRTGKSIADWQKTKEEFSIVLKYVYQNFSLSFNEYQLLCRNANNMSDKIIAIIPTLENILIKDKQINIAIYGAGSLGIFSFKMMNECFSHQELFVECFIDKKAESDMVTIEDKPVISLTDYVDTNKSALIFIASIAYYDDIYQHLCEQGLEHLIIQSSA